MRRLPPAVAGAARAVVEAAALAAIGATLEVLDALELDADVRLWVPVAILAGRTLEGIVDQLDPTRRRAPSNQE